MKKQLTIIIGLLLSSSITVHAQVAQKLRELGMENIRTIETGGTTVAAFEDNVYRGTYRGVGKAIIAEWKEWATAILELVALDGKRYSATQHPACRIQVDSGYKSVRFH